MIITIFTIILFFHVGGYNLIFVPTNTNNTTMENITIEDTIIISEDFLIPSSLSALEQLENELTTTLNINEDKQVKFNISNL